MYRMCRVKDNIFTHVVSECGKLAQNEYTARYGQVCTAVHWSLLKSNELPHSDTKYTHTAEDIIEHDNVKILPDFDVYVNKFVKARRPDIIMANKGLKECMIINIAVSGDVRTKSKENWKIKNSRDLTREI